MNRLLLIGGVGAIVVAVRKLLRAVTGGRENATG